MPSWRDRIQNDDSSQKSTGSWRDRIQDEPTPSSNTEQPTRTPNTSMLEAALSGGAEGLTLGFDDELVGAGGAGVDLASDIGSGSELSLDKLLNSYRTSRDRRREQKAQQTADRPGIMLAANIAGGVLPMLFTGGTGALAAGAKALAPTTLKGMALLGGAAGAGTSQADLTKGEVDQFALDTGIGAGLGTVLGKLAPKAGTVPLKTGALGAGIGGASALLDEEATGEDVLNRALSGGLIGAGVGVAGKPILDAAKKTIKGIAKPILGPGMKAYEMANTPVGQPGVDVTSPEFQRGFIEDAKTMADEATEIISGVKAKDAAAAQTAQMGKPEILNEINVIESELTDLSKVAEPQLRNNLNEQRLKLKELKTEIKNTSDLEYDKIQKEVNEQMSVNRQALEDLKLKKAQEVEQFNIAEENRKAQFEREQLVAKQQFEVDTSKKYDELDADLQIVKQNALAQQEMTLGKQREQVGKTISDVSTKSLNKINEVERTIINEIDKVYQNAPAIKSAPAIEAVSQNVNVEMLGGDEKAYNSLLEQAGKVSELKDIRAFKKTVNELYSGKFNANKDYQAHKALKSLYTKLDDIAVSSLENAGQAEQAKLLKEYNKKFSVNMLFQDQFVSARESTQMAKRLGTETLDTSDVTNIIKKYKIAQDNKDPIAQDKARQELQRMIEAYSNVDPVAAQELQQNLSSVAKEYNTVMSKKPELQTNPLIAQKTGVPLTPEEMKINELENLLANVKGQKFPKQEFQPGALDVSSIETEQKVVANKIKDLSTMLKEYKNKKADSPLVSEAESKIKAGQDELLSLKQKQIELNKLKTQKQSELLESKNASVEQSGLFQQFKSDSPDDIANKFMTYIEKSANKDNQFEVQRNVDKFFNDIETTKGPEFKAQIEAKMKDLAEKRELYMPEFKATDVFTVPGIGRTFAKGQAYVGAKAGKVVKGVTEAINKPTALITDATNKITDDLISRVSATDANLGKILKNITQMPPEKQQRAMFAIMQNPVYRNKINQDSQEKK